MRVEDLLVFGKRHIHSDYAKFLLADLLNYNFLEMLNHLDEKVDYDIAEKYKKEVLAMEEGKPLQYAIGNVNFYGNKFIVNENVLIPRFETEELVENTLTYISKLFTNSVEIIDLGCGSGIIGLTLKQKLATSSVDLIDISEEALEVANMNSENLGIEANIYKSDMFSNVTKQYDVVISNPPYIKTNEEIEEIVKNYEPHLALYAGEEGLDCYNKIFDNIKPHLKNNFLIALEIGMTQKDDIISLAKRTLGQVNIDVKKDMSGKVRMIFIYNMNKI